MNGTVDTLIPPAEKSGDIASDIPALLDRNQEQGVRVMEELFAAARPGVFCSTFGWGFHRESLPKHPGIAAIGEDPSWQSPRP